MKRVLIVEDDYFIASELSRILVEERAEVLGPFADVAPAREALMANPDFDLAILDIKLRDGEVYGLAEDLLRLGRPFVFASGLSRSNIPHRYAHVPLVQKPYSPGALLSFLRHGVPVGGTPLQNELLKRLPARVLAELRPHMAMVPIVSRRNIVRAGDRVGLVYFPISGVYSILFGTGSKPVEVALVGREGMVEAAHPEDAVARYHVWSQAPGGAVAISRDALYRTIRSDERARDLFDRYRYVHTMQMAEATAANAIDKVPARLARWLLEYSDRVGDEMPVVHEFLSNMLQIRRAGITEAIQQLEGLGAIKASRGHLSIRDRLKLLQCVSPGLRASRKAYDDLVLSLPAEYTDELESSLV